MPNMTLSSTIFPFGPTLPGSPTLKVPVTAGVAANFNAPLTVMGDQALPTYTFGFWVINAQRYLTQDVSLPIPDGDFSAIAWYFGSGSDVQPIVSTYAFSLDANVVLPNQTPIASVVPASDWAGGGATTVSDAGGPVTITALPVIPGSGPFKFWMPLEGAGVSGPVLNVAANQDVQAIAFYGLPTPDPCADLRAQLQDISLGDFPNPQAYQTGRMRLLRELTMCERQYGELV